MSDKIYLLVCEGPTDIQVIDKITKKISTQINDNIIVRELAPQRDKTTKRYPNHGWEEVRRWCKLYGKSDFTDENPFAKLAQQKNWQALVSAAGAEGLIIQMDTDIAQYIEDIMPTFSQSTKKARKTFCEKSILKWLGLSSIPENIYLLLSTYSTETWILATHDRVESVFKDLEKDFDYECISDSIERLISLGYNSYIDEYTGKEKLSKDLHVYSAYSNKIVNNLLKVRSECEEVEKFCSMLEK